MSVIEPSELIGKYKIECVLGKGAMGVVYRALDTDIDRTVGLKTLHAHLLEGEQGDDFSQRFLQEAKAAARCLHANIVTVFDFGVHDSTPFIVMEYVDGVELKSQMVADMTFSLGLTLDIIKQILEALDYAHENGVVHRDIKPANIMIMDNGRVKVSDFGVARLDNSNLTSTGMMVGTPNYMSPEAMYGLNVDGRSDLYSVGILLFELITKKRPLPSAGLEEAMEPLNRCTNLNPVQLKQIRPLILKALQPNPEARFQNATEFLIQINSIASLVDSSQEFGQDTDQKTIIFRPPPLDRPKEAARDSTSQTALGDQSVLSALESSLVRYIGPAAKALIKKQCKTSTTLSDLSLNLARHIPNDDERSEFLKNLESTGIRELYLSKEAEASKALGRTGILQTADKKNATLQLPDEILQSVTSELAFFVGPLASRLINKTLKRSSSLDEFYKKLASYIPDQHEQDTFLKKVKK
ncbi:MAG: serine/threonine protein kinase [Oleiphilaceae bacterium]|jgi:serine/threonine-protein kinase